MTLEGSSWSRGTDTLHTVSVGSHKHFLLTRMRIKMKMLGSYEKMGDGGPCRLSILRPMSNHSRIIGKSVILSHVAWGVDWTRWGWTKGSGDTVIKWGFGYCHYPKEIVWVRSAHSVPFCATPRAIIGPPACSALSGLTFRIVDCSVRPQEFTEQMEFVWKTLIQTHLFKCHQQLNLLTKQKGIQGQKLFFPTFPSCRWSHDYDMYFKND